MWALIPSCLILLVAYNAAVVLNFTLAQTLVLFAFSYFGQDLAHYLTSEPTFQYLYTPSTPGSKITSWPVFFGQLTLHTYFMLPLVIDACVEINLFEEILSWFLVLDRIIRLKLNSSSALKNLTTIRTWLDNENLPNDVTTHYWFSQLPDDIKHAFRDVANEPIIFEKFSEFYPSPLYKTVVLESMNEVYVAAVDTENATSDNVFYSNHGVLELMQWTVLG
jgi:hypothetical protein